MAGFGLPEFFSIFIMAFFVYGVFITIDAIRRPSNQYKTGQKSVWVSVLILTNPLINIGRFFGSLFALLGVVVFIATTIAYHIRIRLGKFKNELTDQSTAENSREERMRRRFAARDGRGSDTEN